MMAQASQREENSAEGEEEDSNHSSTYDGNETPLEEIIVTGSRIRSFLGEITAVPVFSISRMELERRGVTRLADIRWAIPQLGPSSGFNDNLDSGGTSLAQQVSTSFNLRGLGGNSTLVLIDGRRVPRTGQEAPGGAGGREDFNIDGIPISAIERIDVLPQGAGAVYGSEAIAGVINVILKKDYSGAELNATYANTFDSAMGQKTLSLSAGRISGRLSTFVTASWEDQGSLAARDRWFSATNDKSVFGGSDAFFLFNPAGGTGSLASTFFPQFGGPALPGLSSNVAAIPAGSPGDGSVTVADYAAAGAPAAPFDSAQYASLIDAAQRGSVLLNAELALNPAFEVYAGARWNRFKNEFVGTPVTLAFTQLPDGYPGNPFSTPVVLRKVFFDLPVPRINSYQRNTGLNLGVRGELLSGLLNDWRYDIGASWARNVVEDDVIAAGFHSGLLNAAIADPAVQPVLAYDSTQPGGNPNPAGLLESLMPALDHKDTSDVYQYIATADGPIWSGWAGDVKLALGAELQEEKVKFERDPRDPAAAFLLSDPFDRRVGAAFAEVNVPLASERQEIPLIHSLSVSGAIRMEDFSDIGGHTSHSYGVLYQPAPWFALRGSRTEGFKAPRLYDLLAPVFESTVSLTAVQGVFDTLRDGEPVIGDLGWVSGGQPDLNPETSVTRNLGIVLDVPFIAGLSFSVDRWELNYRDKVGEPDFQVLIDFFPERVTRAPSTGGMPGIITGFDSSVVNLTAVDSKGIDYRLSYQHEFGFGDVMVSAALADPDPIVTRATPAAEPSVWEQPKRISGSLFWARGPWDAGAAVNYQEAFPSFASATLLFPSYIEWNPQLSFDFERDARFGDDAASWWARLLAGSKLSLTALNVFNNEPSEFAAANSRIVMDPRLRRYILSFSKSF